jgi:FAD:protein FMN transferase
VNEHFDSFRAMNTDVDVIVYHDLSPSDAFLNIRMLFERQEARFSRFRPDSLLSRLNAGETVSDELLARVCRHALQAFEFTGGLFNPMVLPALRAAGYDRTFEDVSGGNPQAQPVPDPREALVLEGDSVSLRHGQLDLGGIVKGWTVDLAVEAIVASYPNLFVNAGGDLRCEGSEPGVDGWSVAVAGLPGQAAPWEGAMTGAVATSTTRKRRWTPASGGVAHHLIDPRTGLPSASPFAQVSAWADDTRTAECWAKAVVVGGESAAKRAMAAGVELVVIESDGAVREL